MKSQIKNQDKEEKNNYNQLEWEKAYKTNTDNFLIYSNDKLKEENIVFIKKILIDKFNIKANNNEIEMMWSEWGELNKAMIIAELMDIIRRIR